jgi:acyl-CoA thioesterase FadM
MAFVQKRQVLFGECDPAGILYTPRIADHLVEACLAFLSESLGAPVERRMFELGVSLPARALNMEFLRSMTWDDVIDVEVGISRLGSRSFTMAIDGRNSEGESAFRGQLTMVCISMESLKAVTIPKTLRQALQPAA